MPGEENFVKKTIVGIILGVAFIAICVAALVCDINLKAFVLIELALIFIICIAFIVFK